MLANLLHDVRYALHGFALRPMFAIVVVLTLAVGIGVNVAVFSIYDRLMLRELNVEKPQELVKLVARGPRAANQIVNNQGAVDETFSYPLFLDLERAGEPFVQLAANRIEPVALARDGLTGPGSAALVSGGFFAALGVGPALGRVLGDEDLTGPAATVVLSHDYWQTAYGADPFVLGKSITVAGQPLTIVGVAPRGFVGTTPGERPDVFAAQRTREIGLRLALGAGPGGVRHMVMKEVGWMAGVGVPLGIVAALVIGELAASVLFGLAPTDPRAIVAAGLVLAGAVFGASWWPARRASRVDPVVALRSE